MLFKPTAVADLDDIVVGLDKYGLSAIAAPTRMAEMTDDEAALFGARARALGIVIGEALCYVNLMTSNEDLRAQRIAVLRATLRKADAMGCRSVFTVVGSRDESDYLLAPHPYMFTNECRAELREIVLRVLDGLDLKNTKYLIEPWNNSFFYQPESILEFIRSVDHPFFGLHLDQMNMVDQAHYYRTTELINVTFDLLERYIGSVHLKDLRWDPKHMFLKWDEVPIGEGILDYETYLKRLATLDKDITCYCEHLKTESEYAVNFMRLHQLAAESGTAFARRQAA